jgi:hypothetical protein
MEEIWKDIKGLEGRYQISSFGNVRSLPGRVNSNIRNRIIKGRILKPNIGTNGYYYVVLFKTRYIHKLVSEAFMENTDGLSDVDHIDENKLNNNINNLRWLTHHENSSRSNKGRYRRKPAFLGDNPRAKKVYCFDKSTNVLFKIYDCAKDISNKYDINYSTLRSKLRQDNLLINGLKYTYYG